jgi:pimeloyl-ACP methyl ester carboxylesterase
MKPAARIAAVAAAAGLASATYQAVSEARDRRRYRPPGQLVDIGGRRLHLVTAGERPPTVIIIPALADNVLQWLPIIEGVAAGTHACVYDRAGVGWSDPPAHGRRTPSAMAADLQALVSSAGIPPPYVLVGHSIGGIVARRFYAQYPGMVAGIVLVDSSHEQQVPRIGATNWRRGRAYRVTFAVRRQARILGARRLAASLGLIRGFDADVAREAPPEYARAARAILLSTRFRRVLVRELLMLTRAWGEPPHLDAVPLTVITSARQPSWLAPTWAQMQDELAALSTDSEHISAQEAGHYVHLDQPDLVIQAILGLVRRCR